MNINFNRLSLLAIILILLISSLSAGEPNPRINFLKSALLPGWGELSVGSKTGYAFLSAEVILWSSYFFCQEEEGLLTDQAFNYAVKYAHIDPGQDYNDDYLFHLTKYSSSGFEPGGYNAHIVMEAENLYPDDPQAREEYIQNNIYSEEYYWSWDSVERRKKYNKKREDATDFADFAKALSGTIVVNHVLSAINSFRISSKLKRMKVGMYFDRDMNPYLTCNYQF